ncbi:MAG: hypothetical protein HY355_00580 [Armatimonadetes bacterium]|nr:hypothetical protein [Armatimonadota bacterium]
MSKLSIAAVIGLGLVGLIAVIVGAVQIIAVQTRAAAPATAAPAPLPAGAGSSPAGVALTPGSMLIRDIVRSVMPAVVSILLLIPSGIVVMSRDRPADHQRWATATISSIVTYWLT